MKSIVLRVNPETWKLRLSTTHVTLIRLNVPAAENVPYIVRLLQLMRLTRAWMIEGPPTLNMPRRFRLPML